MESPGIMESPSRRSSTLQVSSASETAVPINSASEIVDDTDLAYLRKSEMAEDPAQPNLNEDFFQSGRYAEEQFRVTVFLEETFYNLLGILALPLVLLRHGWAGARFRMYWGLHPLGLMLQACHALWVLFLFGVLWDADTLLRPYSDGMAFINLLWLARCLILGSKYACMPPAMYSQCDLPTAQSQDQLSIMVTTGWLIPNPVIVERELAYAMRSQWSSRAFSLSQLLQVQGRRPVSRKRLATGINGIHFGRTLFNFRRTLFPPAGPARDSSYSERLISPGRPNQYPWTPSTSVSLSGLPDSAKSPLEKDRSSPSESARREGKQALHYGLLRSALERTDASMWKNSQFHVYEAISKNCHSQYVYVFSTLALPWSLINEINLSGFHAGISGTWYLLIGVGGICVPMFLKLFLRISTPLNSAWQILIFVSYCLMYLMLYVTNVAFLYVAAVDFQRRAGMFNRLRHMLREGCSYDGAPTFQLNMRHPATVINFLWTYRVIHDYGRHIMLRLQKYTTIFMLLVLLCVVYVGVCVLGQTVEGFDSPIDPLILGSCVYNLIVATILCVMCIAAAATANSELDMLVQDLKQLRLENVWASYVQGVEDERDTKVALQLLDLLAATIETSLPQDRLKLMGLVASEEMGQIFGSLALAAVVAAGKVAFGLN
eukprot:gb/GEZN01002857.1/.p1 GENE.gb/GEZN01002857.1/~~gb/GEZN01002857.1/.p1  ORF type:complete len:661 (-),score=91.60 gb/GEZN01002857.1/:213-2195(-)